MEMVFRINKVINEIPLREGNKYLDRETKK